MKISTYEHDKSNVENDLTDRYEDIEKLAKEEAKGIPTHRNYWVMNNIYFVRANKFMLLLENSLVELVMHMLEIVVEQFVLLLICVLNHST